MNGEKIEIEYTELTEEELNRAKRIEQHLKYSPHVVILGAGASKANIINGDKNGLKTPCMDDFFDLEEFKGLLDNVKLKTNLI